MVKIVWYTHFMIASVALVALFLSDFVHPAALPQVPQITSFTQDGDGELLVSVSSAGVYGSIARGASHVQLASLNLSASCDEDIRIESIRVKHVGLGLVSDIDTVYLADGFRRISRGRPFDQNDQSADLRIPQLIIPKCEAVRLSVFADFSRDADVASEHGVSIFEASPIQSTAKSVNLIQGNASEKVTATPDKIGSVTVTFLPVNTRFRYGRTETVARLQLTADPNNDFLLKKIMLTNKGGARDMNLINLQLETRTGNILTAPVQRMKGEHAIFEFEPTFILKRGTTVVLLLTAQINASQSKKINFTLEESSDLETTLYRPRR